jgi:hypothetical protein
MTERVQFDGGPTIHGLLANPRTIVQATYLKPELPKFAGNPCIEALPYINTKERAIDQLLRLPDYESKMRLDDEHLRTHRAMDVLHFFQPLSTHLKIEGMISRCIRDGYIDRNPLDLKNSNNLAQRMEYFKTHPYTGASFSTNASGFIVCGMSGIGKSTGLSCVLSLYPQVIMHSNYQGQNLTRAQIAYVIVECPKDGSTKGLCQEFFKTLDYIMCGETSYAQDFGKDERTTIAMTNSMAGLAKTHLLGLLVIDEIQYLNVAKSGGAEELLNFFVRLVNTIGIPVVLIGTYDAAPLFRSTFRQARRGSGQGDLIWDPLPYSTDLKSDWRLYAESLWEFQYVRTNSLLTDELSKALHEVSYGVVDLANRIYFAAQVRAIETKEEVITEGMLRSVYRDDFRLLSHIIETMKSGTPEMKSRIKDIERPSIIYCQTSDSSGSNQTSPPTTTPEVAVPSDGSVVDTSASGGKRINENPPGTHSTPSNMGGVAPKARKDGGSSGGRKRGKKGEQEKTADKEGTAFEEDDLRGIIARAASTPELSPYQALQNAGVIRKPTDFVPDSMKSDDTH